MKITSFIATLADVEYTPDTIVADIISNLENMEQIVLPALSSLNRIELEKTTDTKAGRKYTATILKNIHKPRRTFASTILERLPTIKNNIEFLSKEYSKVFSSKSVFTSGLTAKKGVFIAELSMAHNFVVYTMDVVDALARTYANSASDKKTDIYDIERYEDVALLEGQGNYASIVNHLSLDTSKFKKYMNSQLDIVIDDTNEAYASTGGSIDLAIKPGFVGNPLYHIGKSIVEYQAKRYKSLVTKKRSLELYIMDLEDSRDGKNNAATEKEIKYNRKRIHALDMDIKKIEQE